MLILTRRTGESLIIGDNVIITILGVKGGQVRIGIKAPATITVHREEIHEKIKHEKLNINHNAQEDIGVDSSIDYLVDSQQSREFKPHNKSHHTLHNKSNHKFNHTANNYTHAKSNFYNNEDKFRKNTNYHKDYKDHKEYKHFSHNGATSNSSTSQQGIKVLKGNEEIDEDSIGNI